MVSESVAAAVDAVPVITLGAVNDFVFQSFRKKPMLAATAGSVGLYTESTVGTVVPPPPPLLVLPGVTELFLHAVPFNNTSRYNGCRT